MNEIILRNQIGIMRALEMLLLREGIPPAGWPDLAHLIAKSEEAITEWERDILITPREPYIDPMTGTARPEGD